MSMELHFLLEVANDRTRSLGSNDKTEKSFGESQGAELRITWTQGVVPGPT